MDSEFLEEAPFFFPVILLCRGQSFSCVHCPGHRGKGVQRCPLSPSQSEREGERIDLPLAGLEKVKASLSFSLLSCLCLCLCLCLCFFFFFLCSWWWWWWWSLCLEDVDSLENTESGVVATGCRMLISKGDCSLPSRLKTPKWIPVDNKESETKVRGSWWQ